MVTVITIDGPSGAGKGTISRMLADKLGFHYLDSGALYRLLGLAAVRHSVDLANPSSLSVLAGHMDIDFDTSAKGLKVILEGKTLPQSCAVKIPPLWPHRLPPIPWCAQRYCSVSNFSPGRPA